jgi:hypothetical protein
VSKLSVFGLPMEAIEQVHTALMVRTDRLAIATVYISILAEFFSKWWFLRVEVNVVVVVVVEWIVVVSHSRREFHRLRLC